MSTMTEEPGEAREVPEVLLTAPPRDAELVSMNQCTRCHLPYLPSKSTSALKLTYCSFLCELGDLGFSMIGLEQMQRAKKPEQPVEPTPEPVGAAE
jgi:hypothetical protein